MSDLNDDSPPAPLAPETAGWEWWARIAIALFIMLIAGWILVFLRTGMPSVYAHGIAIPMIGFTTVPIMFWGLFRTFFRPPAIQRPRTIAFVLLIATGYLGNVPIIAPPLSTENWTSPHAYRLPFNGTWYTLAGGDSTKTNYHATTPTYRWGYDFSLQVDGKSAKLDGRENTDYYCFGRPVLAPVSGEVVGFENTVEDNVPGEVSPEGTLGNYVAIQAGPHEFVYIAQLKRGSVMVTPGDRIEAGQPIGACGNSGRSIEPHVHVHAQNTAEFPFSESLPLKFSNYTANGKRVELGMPVGPTAWNAGDGESVQANQTP